MPQATASTDPAGTQPARQATLTAWQRTYVGQTLPTLPPAHTQVAAPTALHSRGAADAVAAWHRWHSPALDSQLATCFTPAQWPWYAALERARVETLASQHLPGMAFNLSNPATLQPANKPLAEIYLLARGALLAEAIGTFDVNWFAITTPVIPPATGWARWFRRSGPNPAHISHQQIASTLQQARATLPDAARFALAVQPLVQALAQLHATRPADPGTPMPAMPRHDIQAPSKPQADPQGEIEQLSPKGTPSTQAQPEQSAQHAYPDYKVFTHQWDEEGPATRWLSPQDATTLHQLQALDRTKTRQLVHRLQRRLMAARLRHWSFDQEEGSLDSRRLARLMANSDNPRVFRVETEAPTPEACVTLLVDQSGSMRGAHQHMTALAIDLAVHTLQACQVRCEVLGFTTRFGPDNPAMQHWQQSGQPSQPGRLNALRHIIYKTPAQPWQRARTGLGLLLREGFGHENIDGEALHWAASRLMHQPQARKILIVLSDGAPYDQATAQAQGRSYLENHLRDVIAQIEASPMHLVAIGAGQDVGRYYRHALTLRQPNTVPAVLFEQLAGLLAPPEK